ncbi:protein Jade-1-like [Mangifera indica]|uniref:protein Jade-1-like n=1 Tax=Mangifera indica TaxID=29780 RepID=UPI001CFAC27A|nr:protein Jade-1-like [Mangifera indica]
MATNFEALPPLKRFRLMQQREGHQQNQQSTFCLPAKKRKLPQFQCESEVTLSTATYSLPAKKRVWALQPDLVSDSPSLSLDLNVEWKPCFNEEAETEEESKEISEFNSNLESKSLEDEEVACGEDDDDGIVCAICQSTDGDSKDPIVLCDGCDLMVHTTCYGNPLVKNIPEGDWFCAQCLASKEKNSQFSCCLCPMKGGAMKPTTNGLWAHVVCAVFVPEVFFEDPEGREGIDCSKVPKVREEKKCYICRSKRGCAIECSEPKCPLWFHVTCGLKEDLSIEYKEGKKGAVVAGFCKDHTELWKKQQQTGKFKIVARNE